jgi:hypothetical protein
VRCIDPLRESQWPEFLEQHRRASIFHTRGWLQALEQTYGYEPVAYTTSSPGSKLTDGWVFCRVNSWVTGRRLVSLPFSDHCEPLSDCRESLERLAAMVRQEQEQNKWNYIEFRPAQNPGQLTAFEPCQEFWLHKLNLQPDSGELFKRFHKDSIQRKIQRAEREGLVYAEGQTELLDEFYHLLLLTRQRHGLAPQPRAWFCNLIRCLGPQLKIRVASASGIPVAAILTLRFQNTLTYKYGCSDARFHNLGGMQFLLWRAIQEAKQAGLDEFDLGRSDLDNPGLITFKDRLGAARFKLTYFRTPASQSYRSRSYLSGARRVTAYMPKSVLSMAGRLVYKHLG